jgi:hypothetical protein
MRPGRVLPGDRIEQPLAGAAQAVGCDLILRIACPATALDSEWFSALYLPKNGSFCPRPSAAKKRRPKGLSRTVQLPLEGYIVMAFTYRGMARDVLHYFTVT